MADLGGFNAAEVEPNAGFDPVPNGKYLAVISKSEQKENSKKNGSFLSLEFTLVEGQYQGRKLFVNLNLDNPSAEAVKIARGELSAICRGVGQMQPKDSCELHDLPIVLTVAVTKRKDTGENTNKVTKYESVAAAAATKANGQPKAAQPQLATAGMPGGGAAPWKR